MCDRCEVIRTQNTVASRPKNTLLGYTKRDVTMDDVPQSGVRVRASKKSLLDCCNSQWKPSYPTPTPQNLEGLCAKTIKLALWQESPFYTVSRCFEVWNLYPLSFFSLHATASVPVCSCLITQECFEDFCSRGRESPKNLDNRDQVEGKRCDAASTARPCSSLSRAVFLLIVGWSATSGGRCGYHGSKWGGQVSIKGDEEMRTGRMDGSTNG